jgi:hypothetical protein
MRKLILSLLACIIITTVSKANKHWFIAVYVDDCTTCLAEIPKVTTLSSEIPSTIVFRKSDRADSAIWMEKFFLQDYKGQVVFNDSLYDKFIIKHGLQRSSVTLMNESNNVALSVPLSNIAFQSFPLNRLLNKVDTFSLPEDALNSSTRYIVSAKYLYLFNQRKGTINTVSRLTNNSIGQIRITDSLSQQAYINKYGKKEGQKLFNDAKDYIKRNRIVGEYNQFVSFKAINDTIYALAAHPIFVDTLNNSTKKHDTIVTAFYSLVKAENGNIFNLSTIENYLNTQYWNDPKLKRTKYIDGNDAYYITQQFLIKNSGLGMALLGTYIMENGDNYAIANYKEEGKDKMVFDQYFEKLPMTYVNNKIGYNYINNYTQDKNYYCFLLDNNLRSVNKSLPDIALDFIPKKQSMEHQTMISDFYITGDILYLLVNETDDVTGTANTYYYKYNLKAKKVLNQKQYDIRSLPFSFNFPSIDKFDPDYLFYEISNSQMLRLKAL